MFSMSSSGYGFAHGFTVAWGEVMGKRVLASAIHVQAVAVQTHQGRRECGGFESEGSEKSDNAIVALSGNNCFGKLGRNGIWKLSFF